MKRVLLISAMALLCGCNDQPTVHADSKMSDRFVEASARSLACLDGLSSLENSGDVVFQPQEARCTEHLSYLQQIKTTEGEIAMTKKLRSLFAQEYICHMSAGLSADRFKECLDAETKLRNDLPGAIVPAAPSPH
jgi:hypothetical protein